MHIWFNAEKWVIHTLLKGITSDEKYYLDFQTTRQGHLLKICWLYKYVGISDKIAHILDRQIASNISPSIKKILLLKIQIFLAF